MSYQTFFDFAAGLGKPLCVPKGTLASIMEHVARVEKVLKLQREQYLDNPVRWEHFKRRKEWLSIDDKVLCNEVSEHNGWVRWLYERFAEWSHKPVEGGEKITPEDAKAFWHALEMFDVEPERWTDEYYRERMETFYEVMRGRDTEGISFGADPLTPEQAGQVILLFSEFLDTHDIRLAVPIGHDCLKASHDGGYDWSTTCGAIDESDFAKHGSTCKKKKCDVRQQWKEDQRDS